MEERLPPRFCKVCDKSMQGQVRHAHELEPNSHFHFGSGSVYLFKYASPGRARVVRDGEEIDIAPGAECTPMTEEEYQARLAAAKERRKKLKEEERKDPEKPKRAGSGMKELREKAKKDGPPRGGFKNLVRLRVSEGVPKEKIAAECKQLFPAKNFPAMYSTVLRENSKKGAEA